ncbi:hypothetical protein BDZ89DRAFT_1117431 [Hymenopellis radicata]|nr:hypothetical protein BDZ89DRAFT_1117431 [Hymenopellis radicata]
MPRQRHLQYESKPLSALGSLIMRFKDGHLYIALRRILCLRSDSHPPDSIDTFNPVPHIAVIVTTVTDSRPSTTQNSDFEMAGNNISSDAEPEIAEMDTVNVLAEAARIVLDISSVNTITFANAPTVYCSCGTQPTDVIDVCGHDHKVPTINELRKVFGLTDPVEERDIEDGRMLGWRMPPVTMHNVNPDSAEGVHPYLPAFMSETFAVEITTSPDSSRFVTHQASTHGGQRLFMTLA